MTTYIKNILNSFGRHINKLEKHSLENDNQNILALNQLPELDVYYIPWTAGALSPKSICALLNEAIIHDRSKFLEFGSGLSTLYLADYFEYSDGEGRVISVEQDRQWLDIVKGYLDEMGVSDQHYNLIEAPLSPHSALPKNQGWYDEEVLRSEIGGTDMDMVLVDGPAAWKEGREMARYPALPFVSEYLSDDYALFLDDAKRDGERKITRRWLRHFEVDCSYTSGMNLFRPLENDIEYRI